MIVSLSSFRWLSNIRWGSAVLGFLTILIVTGGYLAFSRDSAGKKEIAGEIVSVERRDITNAIKALGTVTLANEQQLRFNVLGKVKKIYVQEGAAVKRDTIIAELEKTDSLADIRQAELAARDASLRLKELEASRDQQLLTAKNSVRDLERQLLESTGKLPSEQKGVDFAIEQAQRTVKEKEAALVQSQRDIAGSIEDAIADTDDILDDLYNILSDNKVRGSLRNKSLEIDLFATDYALKEQMEFSYYDVTTSSETLRAKYPSILNETDTRKLSDALKDTLAVVEQLADFADLTYRFLLSVAPSRTHPESDIITLKSTANTARTTAIALLDSLHAKQATLTGPRTNTAAQDLDDAREALALLQSKKDNRATSADALGYSIEKTQDSIEEGKVKYTQTKTSVDIQIDQQRNTLAQRQVALEKARRALEKYELRAPFDGVVRRIDFQVGDNLLADANETKYVVLENPDHFIVTVQLDQVDVVHVKESQPASITFDALPTNTFDGIIDTIDTTPIQASGVVSYEVKITLQPTGHTILSGMTAKVEIQTASVENALAVPNFALRTQGNRTFVTREDGSRIPIETGLTDGTYTEVLSGLQPGDRIQSIDVSLQNPTEGQNGARGGLSPFGGAGGLRTGGGARGR
ncbi:efflux RND transporter periplasmic adaptor subunit [Candidatus Peregrinibacteria bacterium]|nr:efflux RND transporter periplasmic adaptor subunit [Candidatus Peregrinibacteria bacterium]